ncbi:MAG: class I SAM-dependent methyltransferase [Zoogloeaceae bacterium]|nr:class I SAM-dependent methyltransferase [Zoogloeaceae bacterium]
MTRPQTPFPFPDVTMLGQIFTPPPVVRAMVALRQNPGSVLEPACGDGAFFEALRGAVGIEIDPAYCPAGSLNQDFFAYPEKEKFDTVIGNPPYVRFQDIPPSTRRLLASDLLDKRSNLYLFFIEKAVRHLRPGGELIFITPRDFLKSTGAVRLNHWLFERGTITHALELGDARIFHGAVPNCLIWRFELDNLSRNAAWAEARVGDDLNAFLASPPWQYRRFAEFGGHLMFVRGDYPLRFADVASVKVGAVSGADELYASDAHGNRDFVYSATRKTGQTRRMLWVDPEDPPPEILLPHKARLIGRKVRAFDESNWWQWGRGYPLNERPRVYVNGKTRAGRPFFLHPSPHFDGGVLAIFPHRADIDLATFRDALNEVDWADLGFVCDGRHLFTQRSLEQTPLPASFRAFLPDPSQAQEATAE